MKRKILVAYATESGSTEIISDPADRQTSFGTVDSCRFLCPNPGARSAGPARFAGGGRARLVPRRHGTLADGKGPSGGRWSKWSSTRRPENALVSKV